jgi:hypothetical protein
MIMEIIEITDGKWDNGSIKKATCNIASSKLSIIFNIIAIDNL